MHLACMIAWYITIYVCEYSCLRVGGDLHQLTRPKAKRQGKRSAKAARRGFRVRAAPAVIYTVVATPHVGMQPTLRTQRP